VDQCRDVLVRVHLGIAANSTAILADSVDMLGDAIVYGFSLYYEFTGQASISGMLAGALTTDRMVTPAGFEPAISTLKGLRPGPG
jgi:ABC-type glucose/galactose transport system permease subunit